MEKRANAVTFKGEPKTLIGPEVKVGSKAPDFRTVSGTLSPVTLADTPAKARLFSVVPSVDTPVCSLQTKKFEEGISALGDKAASYTISLDTPFAQKRFCGAENIKSMQTLSDVHDGSFGKNWGVLIEGLPLPLLAR
jgi:thioredoxin-dependent peroxiredoxin